MMMMMVKTLKTLYLFGGEETYDDDDQVPMNPLFLGRKRHTMMKVMVKFLRPFYF